MDTTTVFLLAFAIGIIAGLRSMTAPVVVTWSAHFDRLHLGATRLAFLGSVVTVAIVTALALVEIVGDKLPKTPSRKAPAGFATRILTGALCGAALCLSVSESWMVGMVLGILGSIAGTLGGYEVRSRLIRALQVPDYVIAVAEDLVAIAGGYLIVGRFV